MLKVPYRPVEDLAFSVAKFIQTGGSFINYYMCHAGTNFGRTAGGPFITRSYDYDAPLDKFGIKREAKWGHLKDLHRAIKLCEPVLVSGDSSIMSLGNHYKAYGYKNKSGGCAAFLANDDKSAFKKVNFKNQHYNLPPWSVSILPDCKNTVYNTARMKVLPYPFKASEHFERSIRVPLGPKFNPAPTIMEFNCLEIKLAGNIENIMVKI